MPLEADTRRTFEYVLIEDRPLPLEQQRALTFRRASARDYAKIEAMLLGAFADASSTSVIVDRVLDGVRVALAGWRGFTDDDGQPIAFDPAALADVLQIGDVIDLHASLIGLIRGDETDRKKSASRSPSGTDGSAAGTTPLVDA